VHQFSRNSKKKNKKIKKIKIKIKKIKKYGDFYTQNFTNFGKNMRITVENH